MSRFNGLIIPRSYNDYFSRSDPTALQASLRSMTDSALNTQSVNPVQNKKIAELIPGQASSENQLADKEYVNSSVSTNTANYISDNGNPFTSVTALESYSGEVTNNDYAFVTGTDSDGNTYYDRYKATVSGNNVTWGKEYRLNNSSFTAAQWDAIQSGITAAKVAQYDALANVVDDTTKIATKTWSSNKISSFAMAGAICTTPASTQTKQITLDGYTLESGATIRVLFNNACTVANPQLQINDGTAYPIKVTQAGSLIAPPRHYGKWRGASSSSYEVWQAKTAFDLIFDGSSFVIIGNPIIENYKDSSGNGYTVYADGLIEQWGNTSEGTKPDNLTKTISFPLVFSNSPILQIRPSDAIDVGTSGLLVNYANAYYGAIDTVSTSQFSYRGYKIMWTAIGY